jgi:DNA-binding transcriptional LysR family regulator
VHVETLKIFCDLVDLESFSLAAERNFITQSAVSQQVRALEDKFKRQLLERVRGRREVKLTPVGEAFYRASKKVLSSYNDLREAVSDASGEIGGTVKVATIYSVGLHELPEKVREFMTMHPAAKIDLEFARTTRVVRDVLSGHAELGVLAFPEARPGLKIAPMPNNRLVLIASPNHKFSTRKLIHVKDLIGENFVHFERDVPTRKAIDKILKSNKIEVHKVAEFDNIETIKRAVEVGFGLSIVPQPSVKDDSRLGRLAVIDLAEDFWVQPIGVIIRKDRTLSPAAQKFVGVLTEHVRK